jgi:hypothetical protein
MRPRCEPGTGGGARHLKASLESCRALSPGRPSANLRHRGTDELPLLTRTLPVARALVSHIHGPPCSTLACSARHLGPHQWRSHPIRAGAWAGEQTAASSHSLVVHTGYVLRLTVLKGPTTPGDTSVHDVRVGLCLAMHLANTKLSFWRSHVTLRIVWLLARVLACVAANGATWPRWGLLHLCCCLAGAVLVRPPPRPPPHPTLLVLPRVHRAGASRCPALSNTVHTAAQSFYFAASYRPAAAAAAGDGGAASPWLLTLPPATRLRDVPPPHAHADTLMTRGFSEGRCTSAAAAVQGLFSWQPPDDLVRMHAVVCWFANFN